MAISRAALIPRVRSFLEDRPYYDVGTATTAGDTGIDVSNGGRWNEGDFMEWQDDGETSLVRSVSGNTVTVVRDFYAEVTDAAHSSIGVLKDPKYRYLAIDQALTAAVSELWPFVWKTGTDTVNPDATSTWYDVNVTMRDIVKVSQSLDGDEVIYGPVHDGGKRPFEVRRNMVTTLAASTVGIRFPQGVADIDVDVDIVYRASVTGTSDIEDSSDLPVAECVIYGALARLLEGKEVPLITLGSDREPNKSVRAGSRLTAGAYYRQRFQRAREALKLSLDELSPRVVKA